MTFSLAARDPESGAFGMVVCSSSPAVAARCLHVEAGVGVAASQNVTNPALGHRLLELIRQGRSAQEAMDDAVAEEPHARYRQLIAVDGSGRTAVFSGDHALGINAHAYGEQAASAGNLLAGAHVPQAMVDAYERSTAPTFEERLFDGFRGALDAGGEAGPVRSVGLAVVETAPWRVTDLRVDDHDDPGAELGRLLSLWMPQKNDYLVRAVHPGDAPSYGVEGDR